MKVLLKRRGFPNMLDIVSLVDKSKILCNAKAICVLNRLYSNSYNVFTLSVSYIQYIYLRITEDVW